MKYLLIALEIMAAWTGGFVLLLMFLHGCTAKEKAFKARR